MDDKHHTLTKTSLEDLKKNIVIKYLLAFYGEHKPYAGRYQSLLENLLEVLFVLITKVEHCFLLFNWVSKYTKVKEQCCHRTFKAKDCQSCLTWNPVSGYPVFSLANKTICRAWYMYYLVNDTDTRATARVNVLFPNVRFQFVNIRLTLSRI